MISWLRHAGSFFCDTAIKAYQKLMPKKSTETYNDYLKERRLEYDRRDAKLHQIASDDFTKLVRVAVAIYRDGESFLQNYPWIIENSQPALEAVEKWLADPSPENLSLVAEQVQYRDQRGQAAEDASNMIGDWWSYDSVSYLHNLCQYVTIWSGLPDPEPDDPCGLTSEDIEKLHKATVYFCQYFVDFPASTTRNNDYIDAIIDKTVGEK